MEWIDTTRSMLIHLGCLSELWVCIATGAVQSLGKLWWDSAHTTFLEEKVRELNTRDELREVFYSHYFSAIFKAKKKMEFLPLR